MLELLIFMLAVLIGLALGAALAFSITMFLVYKSNDTDNREGTFEDYTGQRMKML